MVATFGDTPKRLEAFTVEMPDNKHGTSTDRSDMRRVGKDQELRRNFRLTSVLGFTAVLMSTWEAVLVVASYSLPNGGLTGMVWMYIIALLGFIPVILSMAEMASMAPTSGGQYHWVSEFAPRSVQRFLSYETGWLCVLGWQANIASTSYLTALQLQSIVTLNVPTYVAQPWHSTLMVIAVSLICALFNTFAVKKLPLIEGCILLVHVFGFFLILIPLWVLAPRHSSKEVFTEFINAGNWPTQGVSCLVGLIGPVYGLIGPDSAVHMSEEIRDASRVLPLAMLWTLILNGSTGLIMVITFAFCLGNIENALQPQYGFAYIDMFYATIGSPGVASVGAAILTLIGLCATISNVATASRQMWSFARDGGLPYSHLLCQVRRGWDIPLNAVLVSVVFTCLLSLINLGSSVAFNAVISLATGAILSSYLLSITCVAIKRMRYQPLPPSRWSLGRSALPCNIIAICFLSIVFIFSFFPLTTPTSAAEMNWSSLLFGAAVIYSLIYFVFWGRHTYKGPVVLVNKANH